MINLKSLSSSKLAILLVVFFSSVFAFSSCKDDDGPSSSPLVGTWYYYDYGEIDYSDSFTFNADGTFVYIYDYEKYSGRYSYDEDTKTLTLIYNDPTIETEVQHLYFISKDQIEIEYEGTYIRK